MTEKKRFVASVDESCIVDNLDNKGLYSVVDTVECLNNLHEENEQLKKEKNDYMNDVILFEKDCKRLANNLRLTKGDWKYQQIMNRKLTKDNEQLKKALVELKEIGDYQAMRIKELDDMNTLIEDEIDKKIAVLTDAKIKAFQNEDEELFMKVKFSIQVLRELKEVILE